MTMQQYGLIGYPLGHSFSAKFFTEKFQREGIDARYDNFEMATVDSLRDFIARKPNLCGLNVTIPHKQAVMPLLDELSDEARTIGAINVIRISHTPGGIHLKGYNSDIIGFTQSLKPILATHHKQALVLGTGGASRAIIAGLRSLSISISSVSRHPTAGQLSYDQLTPDVMASHTLIVNCTPLGMHPNIDSAPTIPYHLLTPRHLLYDLVYNPLDTRFMQLGREHGAQTKNGLEMLHLQALAAWQFWHEDDSNTDK